MGLSLYPYICTLEIFHFAWKVIRVQISIFVQPLWFFPSLTLYSARISPLSPLGSEADGFQRFSWPVCQAAPPSWSLQGPGFLITTCSSFMGLHFSFSISSSYFILPLLMFYLQLHSWNSWECKLRAFKQFDLWDSQNCFPRMASVCRSLLCSYGFSFSALSALTHRLINWKPRRFATRWTPCGTRRWLIVESPRKTCTAKHSGKCLEASIVFISFLSEDRRISPHLPPFCLSCTPFTVPMSFLLGSLSFLPLLNPYLLLPSTSPLSWQHSRS